MSFNIDNFGSDASNAKSILGGICYYRYYNKDSNTITAPGYFPASLGLQVGDRITVIPASKTDADEEYIVSSITNRVVTVTKVETGGVSQTTATITLASTDWSSHSQTKTVSGVTADNTVIVSPDPASAEDYAAAGILCTAQATDSLTFTCSTDPETNISVNVVILS